MPKHKIRLFREIFYADHPGKVMSGKVAIIWPVVIGLSVTHPGTPQ